MAGTPNKVNADLKQRIANLIDKGFEQIVEDLNTLEPKDRILAYQRFIEYILPKQREQKIDLSSLSEDQIDALLDQVVFKLS